VSRKTLLILAVFVYVNLHHVDLIEMDSVLQFKKDSARFLWKCHRRFIAGELIQEGWKVVHSIEKGRVWIPRKRDQVLMAIGH
jgi:uncharacterized protein (DUF488 family)